LSRTRCICAFLAAPVFFIYLCSCASTAGKNTPHAYITDTARYGLLPPDGIEQSMDMAQFVSASFQGQEYFMHTWVRADTTGMEMTMFNEFGTTMGELSYREGLLHFSSAVFPDSMRPEYIVADFQLCFYNPLLLRQALKKSGLGLEIEEQEHKTIRRIMKGKNIIIEIEREHNAVRLTNNLRGYKYTLEGEFN
jgi:hypothetical protein